MFKLIKFAIMSAVFVYCALYVSKNYDQVTNTVTNLISQVVPDKKPVEPEQDS